MNTSFRSGHNVSLVCLDNRNVPECSTPNFDMFTNSMSLMDAVFTNKSFGISYFCELFSKPYSYLPIDNLLFSIFLNDQMLTINSTLFLVDNCWICRISPSQELLVPTKESGSNATRALGFVVGPSLLPFLMLLRLLVEDATVEDAPDVFLAHDPVPGPDQQVSRKPCPNIKIQSQN